jgi:hypothetical protein
MSVFVQHSNGSIRRVRHSFGGSTAWKQHAENGPVYNESCTKVLTDRGYRSRTLAAIDDLLAADDLRDLLVLGAHGYTVLRPVSAAQDKPRRRHRKSRHEPRFQVEHRGDMFMGQPVTPGMVSTPVAKPKRPAIRIVISPSGKMCAVPLEDNLDDAGISDCSSFKQLRAA